MVGVGIQDDRLRREIEPVRELKRVREGRGMEMECEPVLTSHVALPPKADGVDRSPRTQIETHLEGVTV